MELQTIEQILTEMGRAGQRLDHMSAVEAGAGNISFCTANPLELEKYFPQQTKQVKLPLAAPALSGYTVLVTGSGCRLRDVLKYPTYTVSAFQVDPGGETGTWYTHPEREFTQTTSEFNSHLAVHNDQVARRQVKQLSVIHAQPPYLVQLSHQDELLDTKAFNHRILRWEPETIVQLPQGIEVLDFMVPGSAELMTNNVRALRDHVIVLWRRHGIMVRSDASPLHAVDKVEYAETGAMYEIRNQQLNQVSTGLSNTDLKRVIAAFGVETDLF